ncbi:hypothetical protein Mapa_005549 [Marchantia paleacea]|nr:hypothetical protein Mapa_005549 [Marchantia paleacea]
MNTSLTLLFPFRPNEPWPLIDDKGPAEQLNVKTSGNAQLFLDAKTTLRARSDSADGLVMLPKTSPLKPQQYASVGKDPSHVVQRRRHVQ